jgi:hypothetical protein
MSFFHNLNKTLDSIAAKPEAAQLNERDMSRAAKGYEKYGKEGMQALAKAGREGKSLDPIRNKYDKYDESVDEGFIDTVKKAGDVAKKVGGAVLNKVGHGSDADMIRDLQKKMGLPPTGEKPMEPKEGNAFGGAVAKAKSDGIQPGEKINVGGKEYPVKEAAKWRDPKFKDKLYTQEPRDYDQYDYGDDDYYNPKPDNYPGEKNLKGGSEFDHNDPLQKGQGIGRSGIKNNILDRGPRKGMPSRDQITSLKGSIKSAKGTHAEPNLPEAGAPMTAKQKSFAALAEPKDKITFADKIAGAKQEVDEMLGDVAAEAMKDAIGKMGSKSHQARTTMKHIPNAGPALKKAAKDIRPGVKGYPDRAAMLRAGGVDEEEDLSPFTNYKKPRADRPKVGSVEHGALHDITHGTTDPRYSGRMVTRRVDPNTGNSVGADDDTPAEKRGRGRPTGTKKAMGAKGPSGKSKLMTREGGAESSELKAAAALLKKAGYKITKSVEEEKTTTRDNHAEKAGKRVAKDIEYDEKKKDGIHGKKRGSEDNKAEKAGKKVTKDIEHDEKKSEKEDKPKKSKSGFKFGEGVYEGLDAQLESLITEGMSVSVNMNNQDGGEGTQSISINADGEDATALSELLKNAGMSQGSSDTCPTCGSSDCGCGEMVDEVNKNNPNWPSNTETSNDALQYSGGLNKPKSTGQSTTPVLASQLRRQVSMEESAKLERSLFSLYKNYTK